MVSMIIMFKDLDFLIGFEHATKLCGKQYDDDGFKELKSQRQMKPQILLQCSFLQSENESFYLMESLIVL
jgi:hypothetical protein